MRTLFGLVAVAATCAACGAGDDDSSLQVTRDGGHEHDAGVHDAGPPDSGIGPCGLYAHEVTPGGACTSSIAWTQGPAIPGARDHHATTIHEFADGPYLMVSGGAKDSFTLLYRDIRRIKLSPDGRPIGQWEEIGTLPGDLSGHTMNTHQGRVYVAGGATPRGRFNTVYSTYITRDGELGDWTVEPSMPVSVWHHQMFIRDGWIYVVGGQSGNEIAENAVQRAQIQPDGTLSEWASLEPLPAVRSHHGTVATDDGIYVLGGLEDSEFRAEVLLGRFMDDGTITAWETVGLIPGSGLVTPSVGLVEDRLFVIAGLTGDLEFVGTVLSAKIESDGTVSPLEETPSPLPEGRGHVHQMPHLNGRMFVVGGRSGERVNLTSFKSLDTFWVGTVR